MFFHNTHLLHCLGLLPSLWLFTTGAESTETSSPPYVFTAKFKSNLMLTSTPYPQPAIDKVVDLKDIAVGPPTLSFAATPDLSSDTFEGNVPKFLALGSFTFPEAIQYPDARYDANITAANIFWIQANMTIEDGSLVLTNSTSPVSSYDVFWPYTNYPDTFNRTVSFTLWPQTTSLMNYLGPWDSQNETIQALWEENAFALAVGGSANASLTYNSDNVDADTVGAILDFTVRNMTGNPSAPMETVTATRNPGAVTSTASTQTMSSTATYSTPMTNTLTTSTSTSTPTSTSASNGGVKFIPEKKTLMQNIFALTLSAMMAYLWI